MLFVAAHEIDLHEVVEVSVQDSLSVGGLVACAQVLDHLVRMEDIASDLRAPLDLFLLTFEFGLFLLTLLELDVVQTGFEDSEGVLPVVKLRACLRVLHHDAARDVPHPDSCLHLVHVLSAGSAGTVGVPFEVGRVDLYLDRVIDKRVYED